MILHLSIVYSLKESTRLGSWVSVFHICSQVSGNLLCILFLVNAIEWYQRQEKKHRLIPVQEESLWALSVWGGCTDQQLSLGKHVHVIVTTWGPRALWIWVWECKWGAKFQQQANVSSICLTKALFRRDWKKIQVIWTHILPSHLAF